MVVSQTSLEIQRPFAIHLAFPVTKLCSWLICACRSSLSGRGGFKGHKGAWNGKSWPYFPARRKRTPTLCHFSFTWDGHSLHEESKRLRTRQTLHNAFWRTDSQSLWRILTDPCAFKNNYPAQPTPWPCSILRTWKTSTSRSVWEAVLTGRRKLKEGRSWFSERGRRTATFQFSESGGSLNRLDLFTELPFL